MSSPVRRLSLLLLIALCAGCTQARQPATRAAAPSSTAGRPASISTSPSISTSAVAAPTPPSSPTGARVPPVSAAARAAGLVDIRTVLPDAIVDLRYATSHNFVGVPLYPANARCLVHESMAAGLRTAAARLR